MVAGLGLQLVVALGLLGSPVTGDTPAPATAPAWFSQLVAVEAPANAQQVTVYFPFGGSHVLTRDPHGKGWRGRVVLDATVPEGTYPVAVVVETTSGQRLMRRELVEVRRGQAPFEAQARQPQVSAGHAVELVVDSVEPVRQVTARCDTLGWANVVLGTPTSGSRTDWGTFSTVPAGAAPGNHQVTITVVDEAGRQLATTITVTVTPGASS